MSEQRSRGGKKTGGDTPQDSEQHQTVHAGQPRPESNKPSDQGKKPMDRTDKDDPSQAPESGEPRDKGHA